VNATPTAPLGQGLALAETRQFYQKTAESSANQRFPPPSPYNGFVHLVYSCACRAFLGKL